MRTLSILLALWALPASATELVGTPKVTFEAEGHPGFLTFEGVTSKMTVETKGTELVFTVPMNTVETGISLRDEHMRDTYVQTSQFPNATLTLAETGVTWPTDTQKKTSGTAKGTFTVHGVSKPVEVAYDAKLTKAGIKVIATFPFNTESHGIAIPSYMGVTIEPAMTAKVTVELSR